MAPSSQPGPMPNLQVPLLTGDTPLPLSGLLCGREGTQQPDPTHPLSRLAACAATRRQSIPNMLLHANLVHAVSDIYM